jgi:predicted enzyme related to lactoylglutathione lyase
MLQAVWIEIPVKDIERAMKFYAAVFEFEPTDIVKEDVRLSAMLVNAGEGDISPGISLTQTKDFDPGTKGPLVYLNTDKMESYIERVKAAGGKVVTGKTSMGSAGFYGLFEDTEGNLLSLYAFE